MLQSMELQRVGHDLATEQQQKPQMIPSQEITNVLCVVSNLPNLSLSALRHSPTYISTY